MTIPEFIMKIKSHPDFHSSKSIGERRVLSAQLRQAIEIIEGQRGALDSIAETYPPDGENAQVMIEIARRELDREV